VDENHLTTAEFENAKIAETIATRGDKSCRPFHGPVWQADSDEIRRMAPTKSIGRYVRVEPFSDGVFAFAITLLVRGFQVPELRVADEPSLHNAVLKQFPQATPYVTSFATIGAIWRNPSPYVSRATSCRARNSNSEPAIADGGVVYSVSNCPAWSVRPIACKCGLRSCTYPLGIAYNIFWRHIVRRRLSIDTGDSEKLRSRTQRNLVGSFGYPLGTAIAFISPKTAGLIYLALALFYFVPEHTLSASKIWTFAKVHGD
jgi:hypothetical protein